MEICIFLAIITIIANLILKKHTDGIYQKMLKPRMEYNYWREVEFKNITPIEAGFLSGKEKIGSNTFIAILLELERKNIINIELIEKTYYISLKCRDLEKINNLEEYESKIIKIIFKSSKDETKLLLSDVLKIINNNLANKIYLKDIYNKIQFSIYRKYYHSYINFGMHPLIKVLILFFLLINSMRIFGTLLVNQSVLLNLSSTYAISVIAIGVLLGLFEIFLFIKLIYRGYVKDEYLDEVGKIKGLYKYIVDFSTIKDKGITQYELYERYYTYAVSMGIADKLEKELKINDKTLDVKNNFKLLFSYHDVLNSMQKTSKTKVKKEKIHLDFKEFFAIFCFTLVVLSSFVLGIMKLKFDIKDGILMIIPLIFVVPVVSFCVIYTRKERIVRKVQNKISRWK